MTATGSARPLFEVSQPRVTCYRLGLRMNEPRMPALVVAHHRPGFYLRVLEEGEVGAGDAIERVERGPEAMTVAEIDGLLYLPGHAQRDLDSSVADPGAERGMAGLLPRACSSRRQPARPRSRRGRGCDRCASPRSTARAPR